ncbi:MAG TPA: hypothetical protein VHV29_09995 [Terriglobales bacterium]|nr:hypothetical protein [Terriglobales bacterium]
MSVGWDNGLVLSQGGNSRFLFGIRLALCSPSFKRDNDGAMAVAFGPLVLVYWPRSQSLCEARS